MKRMGAVETDSVKSVRKAKDKLHKACERASETRERTLHGQEQNNAHGKHERVTRQSSQQSNPEVLFKALTLLVNLLYIFIYAYAPLP